MRRIRSSKRASTNAATAMPFKALAGHCDQVIVVGSQSGSNSRLLEEVTMARGIDGDLIDGPEENGPASLQGRQRIGVTAGAPAPEIRCERWSTASAG